MRKILILSLLLLVPKVGQAQTTVIIEPDGYIGSGLSNYIGVLVATVHKSGYPCNSVTIVRKLWGKTGFKIKCDRAKYSYEVIINKYGDYQVSPN